MTLPAHFAERKAQYQSGLWRIAWSRANNPTGADAAIGINQCQPLMNDGVNAVVEASVDAVIQEFYNWGAIWNKNPACLAQGAWANLKESLSSPARIVLFAALNVLLVADPSGESSRRHDICRPWAKDVPCPSIITTGEGAGMKRTAEWISQVAEIKQPALDLTMGAPDVLAALVMAQVTGDGVPELFGFQLKVRAELGV